MRVLLQRVSRASVTVEREMLGQIGTGFVALVGVTHDDSVADAEKLAAKLANMRVFPDDTGAMNRSALDLASESPSTSEADLSKVAIAVLVVSQFTLYADLRKGRRPSFVGAARPEHAEPIVDHFADTLRSLGLPVASGRFGADMDVELVNDGPVTIWLDSDQLG